MILPTAHADVKKTKYWELFSKEYRARTFLIFVLWFGAYYSSYGFTLLLPTIYTQITHITLNQALLITTTVSLFTGLGLPYSFFTGYLADKIGRRFMLVFGFGTQTLAFALGYLAFVVFHLSSWFILYASSTTLFNTTASLIYVYNPELFPTRMRAFATASGSAMNRLASTVAAPVNALLLGGAVTASHMTLAGLGNVYLVIVFVSWFTFVVTLLLAKETACRQLEEISH